MSFIDHRTKYRGRKARLGSLIITDDHKIAFFVGYCDCGCNRKFGLSPEEARSFGKQFYQTGEARLNKTIASPIRAVRHIRATWREASKIAAKQL